jgi:hypothetical protein
MYRKLDKEDKCDLKVYNCHHIDISQRNWNQDHHLVMSCDPGNRSLGICVQQRFHNGMVKTLALDCYNLNGKKVENGVTIIDNIRNLCDCLDSYQCFFPYLHFVVIESQLPINRKASAIMNAIITYLSVRLCDLPLLPSIILVNAHLKGRMLRFPVQQDIKISTVVKARQLLTLRQDSFLHKLEQFKKKDDVADAYCQVEALFLLWNLAVPTVSPFI